MRVSFKYKRTKVYKHELKEALDECFGVDNYTVNDVLDYLCIHAGDYPIGAYDVIKYPTVKTNTVHRLNTLWVYPMMVFIVCPIKWFLTGDSGFKEDSTPIKVLQFLLGKLK